MEHILRHQAKGHRLIHGQMQFSGRHTHRGITKFPGPLPGHHLNRFSRKAIARIPPLLLLPIGQVDMLHRPQHPQAGIDLHGIHGDGHHDDQGNGGPNNFQLGVAFNRLGVTGIVFFSPVTQDHPGHHRGHRQEHKGAKSGLKAE